MITVITCSECFLKYEADEQTKGMRCPWCGPNDIGVGASFDEACRNALFKLWCAGQQFVHVVEAHTVHFKDAPSALASSSVRGGAGGRSHTLWTNDIVHMVKLSRRDMMGSL